MMPAIELGRTIVTVSATGLIERPEVSIAPDAAAAASYQRPARSSASTPCAPRRQHHPVGADGHRKPRRRWQVSFLARGARDQHGQFISDRMFEGSGRAAPRISPTVTISLRQWLREHQLRRFALITRSTRSIATFIRISVDADGTRFEMESRHPDPGRARTGLYGVTDRRGAPGPDGIDRFGTSCGYFLDASRS